MPRNVGTPEQAARAKSETQRILDDNKVKGLRGLTKTERRLVSMGLPDIHIYNVSPIWEWLRPVQGRGQITSWKCKQGAKVSEVVTVPGIVIRDFDRGSGIRQAYSEEGIDIVQDILHCSKDYPGMPQNDLTNYGVFYVVGKELEDLPVNEQQNLLDDANTKHSAMCRTKVLEADQMWANPHSKGWLTEMYRLCALHVHEEREWVAKRGKTSPVIECPFCSWEIKRGLAKCPNCKEILDQALYDSLRKGRPKQPEPHAEA